MQVFKSILFLFLFASLSVNAEKIKQANASEYMKEAKEIYFKEGFNTPLYILLNESSQVEASFFLQKLSEVFKIESNLEFVLIDEYIDELGITHKKYQQHTNGVAVFMSSFTLHLEANYVKSASGKFYSSIKHLSPQFDEENALQIALNHFNANSYKWQFPSEEAFIQWESNNSNATFYPKGKLVYMGKNASEFQEDQKLCYRFSIYAQEPLEKRKYYIDASNGEIVLVEEEIHHGDVPAVGHTAYSGVRNMVVDSVSNFFRLRESNRGNGIETYDMNNSTQYGQAVDFIDSSRIWDTFSPALDRYATDAHWGTEMTYDYFLNEHGRNSINNQGFTLRSYIHYGTNYVNAFWDGQRMTYGDGDATTSPLTTLDITGHEITHGLTNFTSQLIYRSESGALNESFSDIFGVAVERYARSTNWNWLMGEDIGSPFRSMSNPKALGDPDTYDGANWVDQNCTPTSGNDWCGVHTNSGVQNYWFYLLSEGKIGINDKGNSYSVDSIGVDKAAEVAFRNNTIYLTASSDYSEARFFGIRSAIDLFGACSFEVEAVTNAWYAVGVGAAYSQGVSSDFVALNDTSFCVTPALVQFESNGSNVVNFLWNFGDGSTSSLANPVHTYSNYGNYTVQLIADGGSCGRDTTTFVNYINVDTANICSFAMNSGLTTSTECNGIAFDSGGLNGNYANSTKDTLIVVSNQGDQILINFSLFDVEAGLGLFCNHDYVELFDGPSVNSPSLGRFCNSNIPPANLITSQNAFTLVLNSDDKGVSNGFQLEWQCQSATNTPVVDFETNIDTTCNGFVSFTNLSSNGFTNVQWDFGDGNSSNDLNPVHQYDSNGTYSVKLKVFNSQGIDSLVKANLVVVNRGVAPTVRGDSVCTNGNAKLWAKGIDDLLWYNSKGAERATHLGDTLRLNSLSSTQRFYVSSSPPVGELTVVPFFLAGTSRFTDTSEAIYFNVYEPILLKSVLLRTNGNAGLRKVDLRNASGRIIGSKEAYISGSGIQVSLNFELSPGNNYSLSIGSREAGLMVNESGANYPYQAGNLMEVTGSSMGPNAYPFFYLMKVSPVRCESIRKEVIAFVDTSCVITSIKEFESDETQIEIFPNPFSHEITVRGDLSAVKLIQIFTINGKRIKTFENNYESSVQNFDLSNLAKGVYFIRFEGKGFKQNKKLIKIH